MTFYVLCVSRWTRVTPLKDVRNKICAVVNYDSTVMSESFKTIVSDTIIIIDNVIATDERASSEEHHYETVYSIERVQ